MKLNKLFFLFLCVLCSCNSNKDFVTIAHRGVPSVVAEHTLKGIRLAHSYDVDYIEADVVLTKDNQPIVIHDPYLDTTTNVSEVFPNTARSDQRYYVIDFTLKQIKQLRIVDRINPKTKKAFYKRAEGFKVGDHKLLTLDEFIHNVKNLNFKYSKKIGIYVEIKYPSLHLKYGKDITDVVYNTLKKWGYDKNNSMAIIQSFEPNSLKRLKNDYQTKIPLVQLIGDNSWKMNNVDYTKVKTRNGMIEVSKYANGIGVYYKHLYQSSNGQLVKNDFVDWAKENNLFIHAYTHRSDRLPKETKTDKEFFELLIDKLEIDGVFTDDSNLVHLK